MIHLWSEAPTLAALWDRSQTVQTARKQLSQHTAVQQQTRDRPDGERPWSVRTHLKKKNMQKHSADMTPFSVVSQMLMAHFMSQMFTCRRAQAADTNIWSFCSFHPNRCTSTITNTACKCQSAKNKLQSEGPVLCDLMHVDRLHSLHSNSAFDSHHNNTLLNMISIFYASNYYNTAPSVIGFSGIRRHNQYQMHT